MIDNRYGREVQAVDDEPEVDPRDAEIERLRQEAIERDKQIAVQNARFDQFERDISQKFAENKGGAPEADDMYQAQQELNISDEELLDPKTAPDAIRRIAEHQATRIAIERDRGRSSHDQGVALSVFEGNMDRLSRNAEFYEDLEPLMRDYFRDNPEQMTQPGKVEEVYERLVGKNYSVLNERRKSKNDDLEPADDGGGEGVSAAKSRYRQSRVVDAPVRTASASSRPGPKGKKPVVLDSAREEMRKTFEGLGVEIEPEEWEEIEMGKKFPKKYAADIQVGLGQRGGHDYESE